MVLKMKLSKVFPTPVGVFLITEGFWTFWLCLPHARGGVSSSVIFAAASDWSSPRPWGCFRFILVILEIRLVFPTPVGVFLLCW